MSVGEPLDLSRELALTKAAVLYASHVTIIGPKVVLLSYVDRFARANRIEQDKLILRMLRELAEGASALEQLESIGRSSGPAKAIVTAIRAQLLAKARPQINQAIKPLMDETRYGEFRTAITAGVVTLDPLSADGHPPSVEAVGEELADMLGSAARAAGTATASTSKRENVMLDRFQERILRMLSTDNPAAPLFDESVRPIAHGLSYFAERAGIKLAAGARGTRDRGNPDRNSAGFPRCPNERDPGRETGLEGSIDPFPLGGGNFLE